MSGDRGRERYAVIHSGTMLEGLAPNFEIHSYSRSPTGWHYIIPKNKLSSSKKRTKSCDSHVGNGPQSINILQRNIKDIHAVDVEILKAHLCRFL